MDYFSLQLDPHYQEELSIEEDGVKLSPQTLSQIRARLEVLSLKAPASSTIHVLFKSTNGEIMGEMSIRGAGRIFHAKKWGQNPLQIFSQIEKEISKQLADWKKTRFGSKREYQDFKIHPQTCSGGGVR